VNASRSRRFMASEIAAKPSWCIKSQLIPTFKNSGHIALKFAANRDDRTIHEFGLRQRAFPARFCRVKSCQIPENSTPIAAGRRRSSRMEPKAAPECFGHQVLLVPELNDSSIRESRQGSRGWAGPIRGKNGLPNRQHPETRIRCMLQKILNCGGPPQAGGSRGRHQQNEACAIGGIVKNLSELFEVLRSKVHKWRLPGRRMPRAPSQPERYSD
jgi:hypothetical protein